MSDEDAAARADEIIRQLQRHVRFTEWLIALFIVNLIVTSAAIGMTIRGMT